MKKILVVSGHPDYAKSVGNRTIIARLQHHFGEQLTLQNLGDCYPNYQIDIATEQAALLEADIIVLQFPLYWYSVPALMKKWFDDVFQFNFAYGMEYKLQGKTFLISFTTGGSGEVYNGQAIHKIEALCTPFMDIATFCKMQWQAPIYSHNVLYIEGVSTKEDKQRVEQIAEQHAERLIQALESLC